MAPIGSHDPVYNFLCFEPSRLVSNGDIMTSLLDKLSISIRFHVVNPLWSLFGRFLNLSTESVGSRRELVANSVHTADAAPSQRISTVESRRRRRCALGVTCSMAAYFASSRYRLCLHVLLLVQLYLALRCCSSKNRETAANIIWRALCRTGTGPTRYYAVNSQDPVPDYN